ncbi:inner membrane-spanning protein YciB [Pontivivens ytuae]|uniref:Inner membrane-spanning protein YciB n=1 Tax=Pontivivens ytuae TaxID=2789856 RepID=A0A7S9LTH0_9RHOB|nr:inner membrane-spanning protein YciB [Pontivivens ytuae]QPH54829.1 septation protein IspZ [Pontivivens ytuae]
MRELNPVLKMALEIGPVIAYFIAYQRFADTPVVLGGQEYSGVVAATAVFVPLILLSLVVSWLLTRQLPRMAVFTAVIVVVFGGLTIWLNDDTFTKMRPTVIYSLFAFVLGVGLWLQGRSYLRYLMGEIMPIDEEGWMKFTRNWVIFFAGMALFNEFTWRVLGEEAWIWLDTFGQMILTFAFIATQFPLLQKHSTEEK